MVKATTSKKIKNIQVPYNLISDKETPHNATYLYIYLKMVCVNNHVKIYIDKLKEYLKWEDTRTIKKYLEWLKEHGYIKYEFTTLPKHNPIELDIHPIRNYFVQVNVETIKEIALCTQQIKVGTTEVITKDLKEMAIRLYYYYVKLYNSDMKKACPTYKDIRSNTGIGSQYIKPINEELKKNHILEIDEGDWYQYEISETESKPRKERNSYKPLK